MLLIVSILSLIPPLVSSRLLPPPQAIFSNLDRSSAADPATASRIPTSSESAVLARRMLHLESIGTFSTVFPSGHGHDHHHHDGASPHEDEDEDEEGLAATAAMAGKPIGLMDYFADCEPDAGNPTILAVGISTNMRNVAAGSNISISVRWRPRTGGGGGAAAVSAASLPRFSLMGYLQEMSDEEIEENDVDICYTTYHPDAIAWLPGNPIHRSAFTRMIVQRVYWVGGFGDRSYIGWIPVDEWRSVTREEMEKARLPGEGGRWWSDWISFG